jgi:GNAT superfamily N-acetyltransferase
MRWTKGEFAIDDERARLDMERILDWLGQSYWAGSTPREAVRTSWERAGLTLGVYHGEELIGCARAVTDFARFAYLSDVYIDPPYRGRGLGQWLVQTMLAHPAVAGVRWVLHTQQATTEFYRQFGFDLPHEMADHPVMQRPKPAVMGDWGLGDGEA